MKGFIGKVVRRPIVLVALVLFEIAAAQEAILINELALQEHGTTGQSPFVELYCPTPLTCRDDSIDSWIVIIQGDEGTNPGWISGFVRHVTHDSTFGHFSLGLVDLPGAISGSPTIMLLKPDHDPNLAPGEPLFLWKDPVETGYAFGVATSGPGRVPRVSAYEIVFSDTTLSTSIVTGLDLPFRANNLTEKTQIDLLVPDLNGNSEWNLEEPIVFVEYPDQVQTATWQLELFGVRPSGGNVLTIWVLPDRDLDTDDDGVLDHPVTILDSVSLPDGYMADVMYSEAILAPDFDATTVPVRAASRIVDGQDSDSALDWSRADLDGVVLSNEVTPTPGLPNNSTGVGLDPWHAERSGCGRMGNYPNPFRETTTISFCTPAGTGAVTITVFDLLGRVMFELDSKSDAEKEALVTVEAAHMPSGVYIYHLQAGDYVRAKHMVVVK